MLYKEVLQAHTLEEPNPTPNPNANPNANPDQGTSGLDALWSGLPLLSLPLRQWCGRMGLGLLRGAALLPGAVSSRREIEDLALALGRDAAAAVSSPRSARPAPSSEPLSGPLRPTRRHSGRRRSGTQPARIEVSVDRAKS